MVLEVNEVTVLMAINAVGMIFLMGMFLHLTVTTLLAGNKDAQGPGLYSRV